MTPLSSRDSSLLVEFARASVHAAVTRQPIPPAPALDILKQKRGCFVSLHKRDRLRGCIGNFVADVPLAEMIPSMAAAAALSDPRFDPVRADELDELSIELSILTPPARISSVREIRPGIDGILIRGARGKSGCFLPQVATETGWSAEEFVRRCLTEKAGLPADAFIKGEATIEIFQAEIFST
ncbi:MAG: AmmeMemoRadiSam system protein A [Candidatus Hydrogenedentota bacterium]